ncbi:hypothetical protein NM688_g6957 [Phlebia brevispora]|uniref:Uncharacterized protein n=1 Tax=Phlebia brevispora TaxID=194682 RepID=A0ACC1SAL2_9APHY|nr:hypothetical protein NM688_g6957 [Phlebia brevispora]
MSEKPTQHTNNGTTELDCKPPAIDSLKALESGIAHLNLKQCISDCQDDLNRGWNFAIANAITLFYGFYALGGLAPIRNTPWLRAIALLPPLLGSLSLFTATAFRVRSAIVSRRGSVEKFIDDVRDLRRGNAWYFLGPEMLLLGLALIPIFAEIMVLVWMPFSPGEPTTSILSWTDPEHAFLGFVTGFAFVYSIYMLRVVTRLGRILRSPILNVMSQLKRLQLALLSSAYNPAASRDAGIDT